MEIGECLLEAQSPGPSLGNPALPFGHNPSMLACLKGLDKYGMYLPQCSAKASAKLLLPHRSANIEGKGLAKREG